MAISFAILLIWFLSGKESGRPGQSPTPGLPRIPTQWLFLERETARSALLLRRVLGPVRLVPCNPDVGRSYYRAETALQILELLEDPDGGSNSLRQWRRGESNPRPKPKTPKP